MSLTLTPYVNGLVNIGKGNIPLDGNNLYVALLTSAYTPSVANDAAWSQINSAEVTGAGYTAGGKALTGNSFGWDPTNQWAALIADPVSWATVTVTPRYGVVYKNTGTSTTSYLLSYFDWGTDTAYSNQPLQLTFGSGVYRLRIG